METAIREFGKKLEKDSTGLFYYAGHGMQVDGTNYLIPIGAHIESKAEVKYETVNTGLVLAQMEKARNGLNIVILDACRNNPFRTFSRSITPGLARMNAPKGSLIAYATAPGKVAYDGQKGKNGVYTKHLVLNIQKPGLKVEEVLKNVRIAVLDETNEKQIPWESSSLIGNFYFIPPKSSPVKINPAPVVQHTAVLDKKVSDIDELFTQAEAERRQKEQLELRKQKELEQALEKYDLLIKKHGGKYNDQAWQSICSEFPILTQGLKSGDIIGLKVKS